MISNKTAQRIKSLADKKNRLKEMLFVVEGDKSVSEALESRFELLQLFATESFINSNELITTNSNKLIRATKEEIKKASLLQNPQNSIALFQLPQENAIYETITNALTLYLDGIQDPGNFGTILRISDWFGIDTIFCSFDTVDMFNPKAIQASMGSFCRVKVYYHDFHSFAEYANEHSIPIYGTFMNETSVYSEIFPSKSILVLGNEGNGIRIENEKFITKKISVPDFSTSGKKPESLNVAVAAAIICSEIKRKENKSPTQNEMR